MRNLRAEIKTPAGRNLQNYGKAYATRLRGTVGRGGKVEPPQSQKKTGRTRKLRFGGLGGWGRRACAAPEQIAADEFVEVAIKDAIDVALFDFCAVILDELIRLENVRPDLA